MLTSPVVRLIAFIAAGWISLAAPTSVHAAEHPKRPIDVREYTARVRPDLAAKTVTGSVDILFTADEDAPSVSFDAGELLVDSASFNGRPLAFVVRDHRVTVTFPQSLPGGTSAHVVLTYHGSPKRGVTFIDAPQQIYTVFATSEWMICSDDPGDKTTLDLTVEVPESWAVVSHGDAVQVTTAQGGLRAHRFVLSSPASTYTYGFAAGRFAADVRQQAGDIALRYVATDGDEPSVRRVFADTPDMLRFFEAKAGVPLPTKTFTQVLTAGPPQQEAAGFVLLPRTYGPWVLDHPQDITLAAHELAHQWWGNRVTCESWNEFWLNEGMATFMAAAYIEHRFGRGAYGRLIEGYKGDYERVRLAGHDKPLVFPDWVHPTADDRTIVYRKGAYVLSLLRERVGEDAFWKGIQRFTADFDGRSVTTADFRREMERASALDLGAFFEQWILPAR